MSKEIKGLKNQLKDLADVLNGFESEYVQLKVLKMLTKSGYLDMVTDKKEKSKKVESETKADGKEVKKKKESRKTASDVIDFIIVESVKDLIITPSAVDDRMSSDINTDQDKPKRGRKSTSKEAVPVFKKSATKTTKVAKKTAKAAKASKVLSTTDEAPKTKGKAGRPTLADRPGPTTVLNALVENGFFDEARSIGAIIEHCNKAQGWILKSTDISGILLGLVKKDLLIRRKNALTDKYEYIKA